MSKFSRNFAKFRFAKIFVFVNIFATILVSQEVFAKILVHAHYCCPICFEAPSGFDNFEEHGGKYCCPICFEAPKIFVIFVTFRKFFSRKAKINFHEIFAKIRKRKFSFQP
jgi:hypothetical protein